MPKMRPCHASSKTSSPFFRGSAAAPAHVGDLSARDWIHRRPPAQRAAPAGGLTTATPIIESRVTSLARSASLRRSVPAGRSGKHEVAKLGARVPDANLRALGQVDAELAQHHARLAHRARAVLEGLVPDGRQPDQRVRIARAERADHEVVDAGRVLDHLEVDAAEAQLLDGRRAVGEQPRAIRRDRPRRARRPWRRCAVRCPARRR